ncbi:MAG: hypothetical protein K0R92_445 [Lachnospiraceae bacterium]|nr:hypothetical protein [Lachnospiraceae bacterium]
MEGGTAMNTHRIKTLSQYFRDVKSGKKNFELRKNDRDYKVGDIVILEEWIPDGIFTGGYTGQVLVRRIQYILSNCEEFGLRDGYCILGLEVRQ